MAAGNEKTAAECEAVKMKLGDLQFFIPGWNLVYAYMAYRDTQRQEKEQLAQDTILVNSYFQQRDAAEEAGNHEAALELDKKIAEVAMSYIRK